MRVGLPLFSIMFCVPRRFLVRRSPGAFEQCKAAPLTAFAAEDWGGSFGLAFWLFFSFFWVFLPCLASSRPP